MEDLVGVGHEPGRHDFAFVFDVVAGRRLHPGIGDDDPYRAEVRAEADHAGGEKVQLRPDLVPTEEEDGEEARLEEEGKDALGGQRAAENVADKARVGGPVGPELEFQDDPGGHADGEG